MANDVSRSWFAVLNNPMDHGYDGTPQEVCDRLRDEWIQYCPTRSGAWVYCVSAEGLQHVHMVLEDRIPMRFAAIKKSYAVGMHFEATMGNKKQAEAYINKEPPFDEKGETIIYTCRHGEICAAQGQRTDLSDIAALVEAGKTPDEIMDVNFSYRKYEKMIRSAYFRKRKKETPVKREVKIHFVVGESGSGKSFTYVKLCEKYGEDNIYFFSDYDGGGFDNYCGEPFLFLDEYKGQFRFSYLLLLLDKYKMQVHARYSNIWSLWTEVYITSVYPPEELYKKMVEEDTRGVDKQQQLMRRITDVTYCFVDDCGDYQRYTISMDLYRCFDDLKQKAIESLAQKQIGWTEVNVDAKDLPF